MVLRGDSSLACLINDSVSPLASLALPFALSPGSGFCTVRKSTVTTPPSDPEFRPSLIAVPCPMIATRVAQQPAFLNARCTNPEIRPLLFLS